MEAQSPIDHIAFVRSLSGDGRAEVVLSDSVGCDACPAVSLCRIPGDGENKMTVTVPGGMKLRPGERVIIRSSEAIHKRAILLATVIPCLSLIMIMTIVYLLSYSSGLAAICGLGAMVIFYLLLYLFRNNLAREFRFTVVGPENVSDNTENITAS